MDVFVRHITLSVTLGACPTLLATRWPFSLSISNLHNLCWLPLTGLSRCPSAWLGKPCEKVWATKKHLLTVAGEFPFYISTNIQVINLISGQFCQSSKIIFRILWFCRTLSWECVNWVLIFGFSFEKKCPRTVMTNKERLSSLTRGHAFTFRAHKGSALRQIRPLSFSNIHARLPSFSRHNPRFSPHFSLVSLPF